MTDDLAVKYPWIVPNAQVLAWLPQQTRHVRYQIVQWQTRIVSVEYVRSRRGATTPYVWVRMPPGLRCNKTYKQNYPLLYDDDDDSTPDIRIPLMKRGECMMIEQLQQDEIEEDGDAVPRSTTVVATVAEVPDIISNAPDSGNVVATTAAVIPPISLFKCQHCDLQSSNKSVVTGQDFRHADDCCLHIASKSCCQCQQEDSTVQDWHVCVNCDRWVHNRPRCRNNDTCLLCKLIISSPMPQVPLSLQPGTREHYNYRRSHTRDLLRRHLLHLGRSREFNSSTTLKDLYVKVYGVPAPGGETTRNTTPTDLETMVSVQSANLRQAEWDAYVLKNKHPTYRVLMHRSTPWPDKTHRVMWRNKASISREGLLRNLSESSMDASYADLVSIYPTTYPQLFDAIVERECPVCFSAIWKPCSAGSPPVRMWGTTFPTEEVPEVSFRLYRKQSSHVDITYAKWCRACRNPVNSKNQEKAAVLKAERETEQAERDARGGAHALRSRMTMGVRRAKLSSKKGKKLHWCGLGLPAPIHVNITSEDDAMQLRFDLGVNLFDCARMLRKRKRNTAKQSQDIFNNVSAHLKQHQKIVMPGKELQAYVRIFIICIVCIRCFVHVAMPFDMICA